MLLALLSPIEFKLIILFECILYRSCLKYTILFSKFDLTLSFLIILPYMVKLVENYFIRLKILFLLYIYKSKQG